jgi:transposase
MAYSLDFRRRAMAYMDEGHTYKELYEAFKIYPSTIEAWRKLLAETGSLEPQYSNRKSPRKIDLEKLREAVKEKPDAYLWELALQFGCTKQAIFTALKKLNITYKKKRSHTPKSARKNESCTT